MKHTATPWQVGQLGERKFVIYGATALTVANKLECDKADAEFIVAACNAHDDLVKALQLFVAYDAKDHDDGAKMMLDYAEAIDAAKTALAKVGAA